MLSLFYIICIHLAVILTIFILTLAPESRSCSTQRVADTQEEEINSSKVFELAPMGSAIAYSEKQTEKLTPIYRHSLSTQQTTYYKESVQLFPLFTRNRTPNGLQWSKEIIIWILGMPSKCSVVLEEIA